MISFVCLWKIIFPVLRQSKLVFYCAQQKYTHKLWISYKDCWRLLYTHQDRVNVYLRIRNCVGWLSLFLAFCSCIWRTFKKISLHATFSAVVQSILCGSTQLASNAIYSIEQHHAYESRNQSDLINATWQHINIEMPCHAVAVGVVVPQFDWPERFFTVSTVPSYRNGKYMHPSHPEYLYECLYV